MARLEGKVALITGAARGQGRAHAVRLAEEGADIVAVDIAEDIESVPYELAREDDLEKTVARVEGLGGRSPCAPTCARRRSWTPPSSAASLSSARSTSSSPTPASSRWSPSGR